MEKVNRLSRTSIIFLIVLFSLLSGIITYIIIQLRVTNLIGAVGETVELSFELDKKFAFGEYYFDLANGQGATYLLCYCLAKGNNYPPDCKGDIAYIYNNTPGNACIPLHIGNGSCSLKNVMNTAGYATMFNIPLEYAWTKPVEKIVIGIKIPNDAPIGGLIIVEVPIFKKNDVGKLELCRKLQQTISIRKPDKKYS